MLRIVEVTNFRCIRALRVDFEPLTVLVGPNASGKTSLLEALLPVGGMSLSDRWRHDPMANISVVATDTTGNRYDRRPNGDSNPQYQILHLDLSQLRAPNQAAEQHRLSNTGDNLTNVFATLPRKTQDEVAKQLRLLVPVFDDVDVRPSSSGNQTLRFHDRWADVWYLPTEVSDGTMLVLALLLLQYQRDAVDVVAIEEPERGLHPWLLGEVVKVLRGMTVGTIGDVKLPRTMQVILATHSAELLEFVEPNEVRFFDRKTDDGSVRVTAAPTATPEWRTAFEEYRKSLGEAWLSGGLGGVPGE